MKKTMTAAVLAVAVCAAAFAQKGDYPIRAVEKTKVKVTGGFWLPRIETNRLVTLKTDFAKCNETPRIANFTNCANRAKGRKFGGIYFDDSDVYKVMEGAAYVYAETKDKELEKYMDWLIGQMAKAQEADGYLYTARTLGGNQAIEGTARWEGLSWTHEFYNPGHMYEAAVAWFEATGKRNFLDIAIKNANLIDRTFGWEPDKLKMTTGHQEMELALCKLYRATGEERYLKLAKFLLDVRGRKDVRPTWGAGVQDHLPVLEQDEAVGHAVRAGYMYSGMADVAALTGDHSYVKAIDRLWENVVSKKMHLTGGVGAGGATLHRKWGTTHESFGEDYFLPNESAYLETCAAIANALWNERMFRWKGEAKYMDVVERVVYNGFLSGISLSGDEFFYMNPLANRDGLGFAKNGPYRRKKWFGCSCCPVNDVRFIPQIPSFAYATDGKGTVYWNLFMKGEAEVDGVKVVCDTAYPWSGKVELRVVANGQDARSTKQGDAQLRTLKLRIPGWAKGAPVPSDLYRQTQPASAMEVSVTVNGAAVDGVPGADGYLTISRAWTAGDKVEVDFPMPVKRIRAHEKVEDDRGRLAVERGPIVYCAEGVDNGGKAYDAVLPEDATFADDTVVVGDQVYPALRASNGLKLVPYCIWGNRRPGNEMQVWFRAEDPAAKRAGTVTTSLLVHPDEFTDRWIDRAVRLGLNNVSMHPVGGGGAANSLTSLLKDLEKPAFRARIDRAKALGLDVGYEMHAASWLLPRDLFKTHPEYFRMDDKGKRCANVNFCVSNAEAMDIVAKRAVELAGKLYGSGHRYFFWLDDVGDGGCRCEKCRAYSASDQQLLFANRVVTELRKTIPDAQLCYLAYAGAINPPEKVAPAPGIFLEYAPIARDMGRPLADQKNDQIKPLKALLAKFGAKGARVLEYWFDNSLYSRWTKPPRLFRPANDVIASDIEYYRQLGFTDLSSFACYLGDDYESRWGSPDVSAFERAAVEPNCRVESLDGDAWEFRRAGGAWKKVRVPHDWAIEGPFDDACDHCTGKLPWVGKGEYRRHFVWRKSGRPGERAYLEFDGVMARPQVKVNGQAAGGWDYGYASFTLDVTALVKDGDNLLEVTADTTDHKSRWYPGAGIYRPVRLVTRGEGHARPGSVFVTTPSVSPEEATVKVRWETLKGPEERTFTVHRPRLWDVDDPYLYEYDIAGEKFRYGIRTVTATTDGLQLNGRRLQVKGVCLHADLGLLGMAFDRDAMKRQLLCMKDMGVNAVRTSHNCPAPQLLDLCDELGFVVWDEAFDKWEGTSGRKTDENLEEYVIRNLKNFVRRDRNHPCVFTYSIGNEIWHAKDKANTGTSRERCDLFRKAILEEDPTRPVGMGCCFTDAVGFGDLDGLDLTGWNYKETYQPMHRRCPQKPLFYSESASAFSDYGYYPMPFEGNGDRTEDWFRFDVKNWKITGYDHLAATWSDIADVEFMRMERDRYVGGEFVWTGIDYLGEPTPFTLGFLKAGVWSNRYEKALGGPLAVHDMARSSYFGIADLCVIPKDRWYLYRAHWNDKAETVHILPHWNWGEGRETGDARPVVPVYVYTSGDEAELFLNGKSLGRRRKGAPAEHPASFTNTYYDVCAKYRLRWFDVPYEPGELKAVAFRGGKAIGTSVVKTTGRPVAVKLTRDPYSADGADLVFVQVDVVDKDGLRSPTSMAPFEVKLEGPGEIAGVGNSDPRSMVSFKDLKGHTLWFGKAVVAVRRYRGTGGAPKLTVTSKGLRPATLEIGGR